MESIGGDLRQMPRNPLDASHVQALRNAGKAVTYPAGTFLAVGDVRRLCQARRFEEQDSI
jgi:hypothetical protein